jgi:hypothetical protein
MREWCALQRIVATWWVIGVIAALRDDVRGRIEDHGAHGQTTSAQRLMREFETSPHGDLSLLPLAHA